MAECPRCHRTGRSVSAITLAHNAPGLAGDPGRLDGWQLCPSDGGCGVVYFRGDEVLLLGQVRATPFHKGSGSDRTVCFCFGHTVRDLVEEAASGAPPAIRASISDACRRGTSDCERANPQGRCCLGDVARVLEAAQ